MNNEFRLTLFEWFYNTIHEFDDDFIIENFIEDILNKEDSLIEKISEKDLKVAESYIHNNQLYGVKDIYDKYFEVNYKKYYQEYSKEFFNTFVKRKLEDINSVGMNNLKFSKLVSPKYYNYDTDALLFTMDYDLEKIEEYIKNNIELFSKYIYISNQSYDWFISFLPQDINEFIEEIKNDNHSAVAQVLNFYLLLEVLPKNINELDEKDVFNTIEDLEQKNNRNINEEIHLEMSDNMYSSNLCIMDFVEDKKNN